MKKVTFQNVCTKIIEIVAPPLLSQKEIKKRWYTQEDYNNFSIERDFCSMKIRSMEKAKLLDEVLPCGVGALIDMETLQSKLFDWTELEMCRGLEMKVNVTHRKQRIKEQRSATLAVLSTQESIREGASYELSCESIRRSSEKYTASARLFAQAIAKADERAVKLEVKSPLMPIQISYLRRLLSWRNNRTTP